MLGKVLAICRCWWQHAGENAGDLQVLVAACWGKCWRFAGAGGSMLGKMLAICRCWWQHAGENVGDFQMLVTSCC